MNKVLDYMNKIDSQDRENQDLRDWQNSDEYKLRSIPVEQDKAKGVCLDKIFSKIYKDAIPLDGQYKVAHGEDLDAEIKDFIDSRCPQGMVYYVKEAIKHGSIPAKKMYDAVENLVCEFYADKERRLHELSPDELVFRMNDDNTRKLDAIHNDLNYDELTQAISANVKQTAASEIARAKDEEEKSKQLEAELKDDLTVTDEDDIDEKLESVNLSDDPIYTPSLFEGIMIGNTNKYRALQEAGTYDGSYEHNALSTFGLNKTGEDLSTSVTEKAFIESVKEMTKLQIIKSMRLEDITPYDVQLMAESYASDDSFKKRN